MKKEYDSFQNTETAW